MKRRWLACAATGVFAGLWVIAAGAQAPRPLTTAQWAEDVAYFARELPKRHKNAFHAPSQPAFAAAIAKLQADLPTLHPRWWLSWRAIGSGRRATRVDPLVVLRNR